MIGPTNQGTTSAPADSARAVAALEDGCYLYGVTAISSEDREPILTGMAPLDIVEAPFDLGLDHARVYLLKRGNLAAVVGLVPLADFSAEALQARLGDPSMLRLAVQMHNDVIHAIHQQQTILPARFGAVYANLDDVTAEIDRRSDALRAQLSWLDGCDEWAVHISVDQQAVRAAILADQALDPVHQQLATVSPGRAYLLGRKWEEGLAAKTAQAGDELALAAYQRLASLAVDGIPTRPVSSSGNPDGEAEVLRAAFLVRRERAEDFVSAVRECGETERGYQCTCSGPWPPYSFVATTERDDDERQDA